MITFSRTLDTQIRHFDDVLQTLADISVTLKINKCHFFPRRVDYLGHMVKPRKLEIIEMNT